MKTLSFSVRNVKEILRDPLNLGFGLGFPLILLFLIFRKKVMAGVSRGGTKG